MYCMMYGLMFGVLKKLVLAIFWNGPHGKEELMKGALWGPFIVAYDDM